MTKKSVLNFITVFILSFIFFEGLEYFLVKTVSFETGNALTLGGLTTATLFILKYHIACCALPAMCSTVYCIIKNKHKHCEHSHE